MNRFYALFLMLVFTLLSVPAHAAKPDRTPVPVTGVVMSADTNKPVGGVVIRFYGDGAGDTPVKPLASVTSDANGAFTARLAPARYTWLATADGYGFSDGSVLVNKKQPPVLSPYLRKEAKLSGRLVDGSGATRPGAAIRFGRWLEATSGPDGRFTLNGLDSRGYEPRLRLPGWVMEKSGYFYLNAGETKDMGDLVIRKASALTVTVSPANGGNRPLERISLSLSGNSIYRSATTRKGAAVFSELPPGHFTITTTDERLEGTNTALDLSEGEQRTITLTPGVKPPSLSIEDYGDVFLPEKALTIKAYGLWVEKAQARIYVVAPNALLKGEADLRQPDKIAAGFLNQTHTFPLTFKARRDSYTRNTRITIPPLQPGAYLLELNGNGAQARFGFLVTRLGLVAKLAPGKDILLFASDLITGKVMEGVTISSPTETVTTASNSNGTASWPGTSTAKALFGRTGSNLAFLELPTDNEGQKTNALKGYVYTDRPAYRPGQTVYFKGVLRQRNGDDYTLPEPGSVKITVTDSGDKSVCEQNATLSHTGSFQGECALAAGTALGGYTITATRDDQSSQGWFKVLEYRKPEFQVKLTPDRRFLVAGDTASVELNAKYYFGGAVAGGKAVWRLYSQPAWGLGQGDGEEDEERSGGYSDFLGEGEVVLDDSGVARIAVPGKTHDMPYTYTLEVDVTDAASRQVSATSSLTVVPSLVALNVKNDTYLTKPGQPVAISLRTATWEGSALSRPVTLAFERQVYDKKTRSYDWKQAESLTLTTAADGAARTSHSFRQSGYWRIKASATDQAGRVSSDSAYAWIWNDGYNWEGSYRDLEAEFDRKIYKPGETARLIVRSPVTNGSLLLTLEGRDIRERRIIPLKSLVEVVELPVTEACAPTIHVSLVTIANGHFYNRTLPLRVDYQAAKLDIKVKADQPVYAPGDRVHLTITATGAAKPVPTELSLAVVDEAIFAVSPERKDDIYQFFRGTREHLVTTLHSFPRLYLGGAAKDKGALAEREDALKGIKVRKTFKDTAFWLPALTSNADGSASAEFTLPDNLTTWRATTVGHTAASEFGTGREKFIARLELMARLAPPRFLTVGDELKIPGIITSMSDTRQTATGRFEGSGLTLLDNPLLNGDLEPRGTLRRDMTVRADQPGTATLRLLAKGLQTGDAMELSLPVLARGLSRTAEGSIALRDRQATTTLTLPENALPDSAELKLTFAPTIASSLNSAISRLVSFPYGCVEQTLSRFIPAVHARALLSRNAWQPDPATAEALPRAIAEGLKRLEEMQHDDGGWGWWKQDGTSLTMTAHALYGLGLAKQAGLEVPPEMLQRGLKALAVLAKNADPDDLPRVYRAMTINGARDYTLEGKIQTRWKALPTAEQLAYGEALAFSGQKDALTSLLAELKREVRDEASAAYILDSDADSWWYGWRWGSSAVETTSGLLSLISQTVPADPLASRLAEFLARRQNGGWWQTTASSAAAVKALADYVAATGEASGDYTARLMLNGDEVARYKVAGGAIVSGDKQVAIPASKLSKGTNTLTITKQGNGAAYVMASLGYTAPTRNSGIIARLEAGTSIIPPHHRQERWRVAAGIHAAQRG